MISVPHWLIEHFFSENAASLLLKVEKTQLELQNAEITKHYEKLIIILILLDYYHYLPSCTFQFSGTFNKSIT